MVIYLRINNVGSINMEEMIINIHLANILDKGYGGL